MRRFFDMSMAVCTLTVAALVPVALAGDAQAASAEPTSWLSGTYQRVIADGESGNDERDLLVSDETTYTLPASAAAGLQPGAEVRVKLAPRRKSAWASRSLVVERTVVMAMRAAPAQPTSRLKTLVILAQWTAPDAVTRESARRNLFTDGDAWFREASNGRSGLQGEVTPWLKIAGPDGGLCYTNHGQIMAQAKAAARAAGFDAAAYDKTIVYFPKSKHADCARMSGWAYVPGTEIWLNGRIDQRTTVHELGHSLGLRHASSLKCTQGAQDVALSTTCQYAEYGDITDAMGSSSYVGQFSAPGQEALGWLDRDVADVTGGGTAVLAVLGSGTTSAVKLVAGARTYYFEYRQPAGLDRLLPRLVTNGLVAHVLDPAHGRNPMLLDLNPGGGLRDAALAPGGVWTTPEGVRVVVGQPTAGGLPITVTS